jgi:DNA-binding GntR family transcriptional regulator
MVLSNDGERKLIAGGARTAPTTGLGLTRLARELFDGHYRPGQRLQLDIIAAEHEMDFDSVLKAFAEFQALGMLTLGGNFSATVHSPNPIEMKEAYEVRAAIEEISGRTAATSLKGNTADLRTELGAMRAAVHDGNLDACVEHDINFHRSILKASQNDVLVRVWNTLAFDLRLRAVIGKISENMREVVESHQPIVDALEKGRGREAGLLLRNHVERFSEYIKKSESDSGFHRALRGFGGGERRSTGVLSLTSPIDSWFTLRNFLQACSRYRRRLLRFFVLARRTMGHRDRRRYRKRNRCGSAHGQSPSVA